MNFLTPIEDSFRYALRNWKTLILLGIILCIASSVDEMRINDLIGLITIAMITILLLIVEEGYRAKIIYTTIKGKNVPPLILSDIKTLTIEGLEEIIIFAVYGAITVAITYISNSNAEFSNNIVLWTIISILNMVTYFCFFAAGVNKAIHDGKLKSAFNVIEIFKIYYRIGLFRTLLLFIIEVISVNLIFSCVIDYGILRAERLLDFILSFFFNPLLLIFTTRLISVYAKDTITS